MAAAKKPIEILTVLNWHRPRNPTTYRVMQDSTFSPVFSILVIIGINCWTQPWVVLKRLNRSRCRLGHERGWAQGTMQLGGGPDPPKRKGAIFGVLPLRCGFLSPFFDHCYFSFSSVCFLQSASDLNVAKLVVTFHHKTRLIGYCIIVAVISNLSLCHV